MHARFESNHVLQEKQLLASGVDIAEANHMIRNDSSSIIAETGTLVTARTTSSLWKLKEKLGRQLDAFQFACERVAKSPGASFGEVGWVPAQGFLGGGFSICQLGALDSQ